MGNRRMMQVPQKTRRQAAAPARWVLCASGCAGGRWMCWVCWVRWVRWASLGSPLGLLGVQPHARSSFCCSHPPNGRTAAFSAAGSLEQHPAVGTGAPQTHPDLDRARPVLFALPFDE